MKYKTRDKVSRIIREDHHQDEKKGEYRLIGFRAITYILSKNMRRIFVHTFKRQLLYLTISFERALDQFVSGKNWYRERKKKKKKKKKKKWNFVIRDCECVYMGRGRKRAMCQVRINQVNWFSHDPTLSLSLSLRRNIFSTERISRKISLISSLPLYPTYSNDREKNLNTSGQADLLRKFKH